MITRIHIHELAASAMQPRPSTPVQFTNPRPAIMRRHFLYPNATHGPCEVGIGYISSHGDGVASIAVVLVEDGSEEIELFLDSRPSLLALLPCQHSWWRRSGFAQSEVRLAAFRQPQVRERDEYREQRLGEDVLDVVDEQSLHGTRALREDGPRGVRCLQVLGDGVGVG